MDAIVPLLAVGRIALNSESFIQAIKAYVREVAVENTVNAVANPPGRRPSKESREIADWYSGLPAHQKEIIGQIIREAVDDALFGLLCVLDGVRAIEDTHSSGWLELHYVSETGRTLLNNPRTDYLHDIYNG